MRRSASGPALVAAALAALALSGLVGGPVGGARADQAIAKDPTVIRMSSRARHSPCDRPNAVLLAYHWPIKPFDRQHPIRGNFGDPRTVSKQGLAQESPEPGGQGSFNFHNGVDISATTGTAVYPVVSGVVKKAFGDRVIVATGDGRTFQYFHVKPTVRPGQRVASSRTVIGTIRPRWGHVHLSEIDGYRIHNPVDPGHLEPYHDSTIPIVGEITFENQDGAEIDPTTLRGKVQISASASDRPPVSVPGYWFGFPVTPALVTWRMTSARAVIVHETIVADFRRTEPPPRRFWNVYAAGTYQNFPALGGDFYFRLPGRYLFKLTPTPLDTRSLPNGTYGVTVDVADVCGNHSSITERVRIAN
jgi:hypothetical protein